MASDKLLVLLSRLMMPLLVLEFLSGMYVNLFMALPPGTADGSGLAAAFTAGALPLAFHIVLGIILLFLSSALLAVTLAGRQRRNSAIASLGLAAMAVTALSGIAFALGGYSDNSLSFAMSAGFIFSFVFYGALAGTVNRSLAMRMHPQASPSAPAPPTR